MPFFSVIVPVYKVEEYLPQCVESVLGQTFLDFELLLIDDGSPDGSGALCDRYAEMDPRVRVIHKRNGGLSSARNCGLKEATGEYIVFLDSDDYWDRADALQEVHSEIHNGLADVVLLKYQKFDMKTGRMEPCLDYSATKDLAGMEYAAQLRYCVSRQLFDTCAWNKVFRRRLMDKCDLFFTEGIIAEDVDWAARLCLAASCLAIVQNPFHVYRKGRPGAITSTLKIKNLIDTKGSIERCLNYVSNMDLSPLFLESYYGYVAYRYVIWMAESAVVRNSEKKPLIEEMEQHRWLLGYSLNLKVKLARMAVAILGFRGASNLLGVYLYRKKST